MNEAEASKGKEQIFNAAILAARMGSLDTHKKKKKKIKKDEGGCSSSSSSTATTTTTFASSSNFHCAIKASEGQDTSISSNDSEYFSSMEDPF